MNNTKIDWCDRTWNPVTGCLHRCPYCYARKIAQRFSGAYDYTMMHNRQYTLEDVTGWMVHGEIFTPMQRMNAAGGLRYAPYPCGFLPTLHRYRLDEPQRVRKQKNIFVCSMADLFGAWVPEEWISDVFAACAAAPQHRYLFLTKNPERYADVPDADNYWFGTTVTNNYDLYSHMRGYDLYYTARKANLFLSIEPIMEKIKMPNRDYSDKIKWVIVGAETGNRKGAVEPKREWIMDIWEACKEAGIPVFMKKSVRHLAGRDFVQEYPWG